jgi:hypothetical protein
MSLKSIIKAAHDAAFDSDDGENKTPSQPTPTAKPAPQNFNFAGLSPSVGTAPAMTPVASPFAVPGSTVLDEKVYQRVLGLTDFHASDVGQKVQRYYDALEEAGLDTATRLKTAVKQAAKLDGITPDQVLTAFDNLKAALQAESDKFARAVDAQNQKEVIGRQQQLQSISDNIARLQQQITDLQAQHTQVSAELADASNRIANAQTQMQLATARRASEIDQQKAQFAGLLH